jgi:uncharacterized membrane protein
MSNSRAMKLLTGVLEAVLAIPVLGGFIVIASGYWVLVVMCVLHAVALIVCVRHQDSYYGSVMGIVTSMLAWIPFLGWLLHLVTAILLFVSALRSR